MENWDQTADVQPLNMEEMDNLVRDMREKREEYEDQKKKASELYKEYAALEHKVLQALKSAGKKSYKVDGLGTFSIRHKSVVTVPKAIEEKRKVFDWIKEKYGDDVLDSMRSINHQTLNSFYNQEVGKSEDPSLFEIPGMDAPTIKEEASFRKA